MGVTGATKSDSLSLLFFNDRQEQKSIFPTLTVHNCSTWGQYWILLFLFTAVHKVFFSASFSLLCFLFIFIAITSQGIRRIGQDIDREGKKGKNETILKRVLHKWPYTINKILANHRGTSDLVDRSCSHTHVYFYMLYTIK